MSKRSRKPLRPYALTKVHLCTPLTSSSNRACEVNVVEPAVDSRKPLKWSRTPIIFDEEDHPDRTTAVGYLLLLVPPTICHLKVKKMLVDDGAGLNLISPKVINKLNIR